MVYILTLVLGIAILVCGIATLVWAIATLVCGIATLVCGIAILVVASFVEPTSLTVGLVAMAFLVAIRLLISDFFSMDIAFSSRRVF